jgi:hypothetical protein
MYIEVLESCDEPLSDPSLPSLPSSGYAVSAIVLVSSPSSARSKPSAAA